MPSLFTAADIADLAQADADIFATRLAIANPAISLVLVRTNQTTGNTTTLAAQTVLMTIGGGGGMSGSGVSGGYTDLVDGTFEAVAPFDVLTGDAFTISGVSGEIATVWPVRNGRRRADFVLDTGGRARMLAGGF